MQYSTPLLFAGLLTIVGCQGESAPQQVSVTETARCLNAQSAEDLFVTPSGFTQSGPPARQAPRPDQEQAGAISLEGRRYDADYDPPGTVPPLHLNQNIGAFTTESAALAAVPAFETDMASIGDNVLVEHCGRFLIAVYTPAGFPDDEEATGEMVQRTMEAILVGSSETP